MPETSSKIAVIIPYRFVPPRNGGHHAAFGFCEALAKKRDVVVVSTTNNDLTIPLPFRLERLFADRIFKYFNPLIIWRLWRFFWKEKVKTCIIQQPFFGFVALPVCRLLGIRFIIYIHNIEFQRFKTIGKWWWQLLYPIEWWMYRAADHLFFISPDDMPEAIKVFGLRSNRCTVVPYGTRLSASPTDRFEARKMIVFRHQIANREFLILFFGPQSYRPNLEAVERIIHQINPILLQKADFHYRILICGGGLPEHHNKLIEYKAQRIDYLGFVEDIETYIKAADVVINPIVTGGGVKTKIIEAIALGTTVLSSQTGAKGINANACGQKLLLVEDHDFNAFAEKLLQIQKQGNILTPASFYKTYQWEHVIQEALLQL